LGRAIASTTELPPRRSKRPWGYDSRGVPCSIACLPLLLLIAVLWAIPLLLPGFLGQCLGHPVEPTGRGRGAAIVFAVIEIVCSPLLVKRGWSGIALFVALLGAIGLLVWARRWMKRHNAHFDVIRAKERERRRKKRMERAAAKDT
jgi:hypothetical protein